MRVPGFYPLHAGSVAERAAFLLAEVAPHGGEDWLTSAELAKLLGVETSCISASLRSVVRRSYVDTQRTDRGRVWQAGKDAPQPEESEMPIQIRTKAIGPLLPPGVPNSVFAVGLLQETT